MIPGEALYRTNTMNYSLITSLYTLDGFSVDAIRTSKDIEVGDYIVQQTDIGPTRALTEFWEVTRLMKSHVVINRRTADGGRKDWRLRWTNWGEPGSPLFNKVYLKNQSKNMYVRQFIKKADLEKHISILEYHNL